MPSNAKSALRIAGLLAMATGCAWAAGQYVDLQSFERRNSNAIAVCDSIKPGMSVEEAQVHARAFRGAVIAELDHQLAIRVPGESLCLVEIVAGRVRSAAVARSG